MSLVEDQRTPRELDDYEYGQAYSLPAPEDTCDVCGDGIVDRIVFNGYVCCGGECAAVVLRELMADELAARAVPEPVYDEPTTGPIVVGERPLARLYFETFGRSL